MVQGAKCNTTAQGLPQITEMTFENLLESGIWSLGLETVCKFNGFLHTKLLSLEMAVTLHDKGSVATRISAPQRAGYLFVLVLLYCYACGRILGK